MEERLLVKRAKLEDAQDVVSEAVTDAFEQIGQLKRDDSFNSWMYRIVANKCNRKMREFYNRQEELSEERRQENSSSEDQREEYMEVRRVFFELPQMDRMIVGMHVFLGYKTREIAQILEMNENTVRSRESRALRRMREQLKGLR